MYQSDIIPQFSFEAAAQQMGLARARELWAYYELMDRKRDQEALALEECMARDAAKKKYVVNEELGGAPEWRMSRKSYVDIYRSSLHERGAQGGELLSDSDFMRWWLKRNPQCRIASTSGVIQSGWTPQTEAAHRLAAAQQQGEEERARQPLIVS